MNKVTHASTEGLTAYMELQKEETEKKYSQAYAFLHKEIPLNPFFDMKEFISLNKLNNGFDNLSRKLNFYAKNANGSYHWTSDSNATYDEMAYAFCSLVRYMKQQSRKKLANENASTSKEKQVKQHKNVNVKPAYSPIEQLTAKPQPVNVKPTYSFDQPNAHPIKDEMLAKYTDAVEVVYKTINSGKQLVFTEFVKEHALNSSFSSILQRLGFVTRVGKLNQHRFAWTTTESFSNIAKAYIRESRLLNVISIAKKKSEMQAGTYAKHSHNRGKNQQIKKVGVIPQKVVTPIPVEKIAAAISTPIAAVIPDFATVGSFRVILNDEMGEDLFLLMRELLKDQKYTHYVDVIEETKNQIRKQF